MPEWKSGQAVVVTEKSTGESREATVVDRGTAYGTYGQQHEKYTVQYNDGTTEEGLVPDYNSFNDKSVNSK